MGFQIKYYRTGYDQFFTNGQPPNSSLILNAYHSVDETKTNSGKRPRPRGLDLLFNGTSVFSSRQRQTIGTYTTVGTNPSYTTYTYTAVIPSPVGPSVFSQDIPDVYWGNRLRVKLRDTDINLAQAFAERAQCEKMFVSYGKRILKAYTFARKGNVSGVLNSLLGTTGRKYKGWKQTVKDTTGVASDTTLAWQYGIRPLISDLEGAVKEYYKVRAVSPVIRTYRFRAFNDVRAGGSQTVPADGYASTTVNVQSAKIIAHAEFQDSAQQWDQSAQRLGLTDPLLLGWELIPYSFVIDWFINVGEFLQASGTFIGLKRIGIHVTTETTWDTVTSKKGGFGTRQVRNKSRRQRLLPNPVLRIKAHPISISHVVSALALIRQVRF